MFGVSLIHSFAQSFVCSFTCFMFADRELYNRTPISRLQAAWLRTLDMEPTHVRLQTSIVRQAEPRDAGTCLESLLCRSCSLLSIMRSPCGFLSALLQLLQRPLLGLNLQPDAPTDRHTACDDTHTGSTHPQQCAMREVLTS